MIIDDAVYLSYLAARRLAFAAKSRLALRAGAQRQGGAGPAA